MLDSMCTKGGRQSFDGIPDILDISDLQYRNKLELVVFILNSVQGARKMEKSSKIMEYWS